MFTCTDSHSAGNMHRAVFEVDVGCLLCDFPPCFLRQGLSLNSVLTNLARLARQPIPGILLSLALGSKMSVIMSGFYVVLGIELRSSCLHGSHFIHGVISPAPKSLDSQGGLTIVKFMWMKPEYGGQFRRKWRVSVE